MVQYDLTRFSQQWKPGQAQPGATSRGGRTSLAAPADGSSTDGPRAVPVPRPPSPRMLTPDQAYFFQKQQHGRPQPLPRTPLGPFQQAARLRIVPNASNDTAAVSTGELRPDRLPAGTPEEAERLHDEVAFLKQLMRVYDEHPAQGGGGRSGGYSRPTSRSSARGVGSPREGRARLGEPKQWQRPSSSSGHHNDYGPPQHLGARMGGPFSYRDTSPRVGQVGLSELKSRLGSSALAAGGPAAAGIAPAPHFTDSVHYTRPEDADLTAHNVTALARAAAQAGVVPAFAGSGGDGGGGGGGFQSNAVRFAVTMAERLEQTDGIKSGAPSTEGVYTCLAVLREMVGLVGPLGSTLQNIHDALQLCLLSPHHYSDGIMLDDKESPAHARGGNTAFERHAAATHGRVPFFVLVRKLEEATAALRRERDTALEEVARNNADLANLEEQLSTAKASLNVKSATIDKLMREHSELEAELLQAKEVTRKEEHKYDVLQSECVSMTRDFLVTTARLEEDVEQLRLRQKGMEADDADDK